MRRRMTFTEKLAYSLTGLVALTVVMGVLSVYSLTSVVHKKDHVIDVNAQALVEAGDLRTATYGNSAAVRAYLLTGQAEFLAKETEASQEFANSLQRLRDLVETEQGRQFITDIAQAHSDFAGHVQTLNNMKARGVPLDQIVQYLDQRSGPSRSRLETLVDRFSQLEQQRMDDGRQEATQTAASAKVVVIAIVVIIIGVAVLIAFILGKSLAGRIGVAVQDIQSSSSELQTTATQQATGARQQATAMTEITTTISELLATSRQIAESAQRVASLSSEAATAALTGDKVVQRAHESIQQIKRQVDAVVNHMLDLGRKSQQIGGIVEIINELAEQTNILAINANIEAAGAGEAGRRFAVVAEEIRKLADRVTGSTKDVRQLVDEVRAAVNTTVMATESGSKAADAGMRNFADVAQALNRIVELVSTNTQAAREIELSTKQQSTAVEQVNTAVANVAQVSREAEASTAQALQTASQLAGLSRSLAQVVRREAAAGAA